MLINSQLVKDHFGHYFKIQTSKDKPAPLSLKAEVFRSNAQAAQFINNLKAPISFWSKIVNSETLILKSISNEKQLKEAVAALFSRGKIKAFKIDIPSLSEHAPEKRSVKDSNKNTHTFVPASSLLITNPREVKKFTNTTEANKYLKELSPNKVELQNLAKELDMPAKVADDELLSLVAEGLASGTIVVVVDRYSAPPSSGAEEDGTVHSDKDASKGPEAAAVVAADKTDSKEPECIYKKMTLSCRHGRSVTLDPASPPKDGEITRLQIVSSQNEDLKEKGTPVFDILTVDAEIDDVCPSHQTNFITIGDSEAKLIGQQSNGKLAKFKSPSKAMLVGNGASVLKYLWLPNVEKDGVKHYKVSANNSCDFSHFDGKEKSIQVDVYPYMKWNLNFNINLGTIKNDSKPSNNKMAFGGALKLQQDNEKADEFSADYKKKLAVFEKTLNNFQNIINNNIFDKFKDGRDIEIDVTLPKVTLGYETQFKEKPGSNLVVRTHEFSFEAAPFINIKASVDILPIIIAYLSSWWSQPFNAFFDWVKQKYGKLAGKDEINAGISFKVSIDGDLGAKFTHKRDESEKTTTEGEPVKSKITIKAEGEAKMDGHVYVVKVEVLLKAGVESSIEVGLSLGSDEIKSDEKDDSAPFVSLDFMFNGVKVYLEKEVQVSLIKDTTNEIGSDKDSDMFEDVDDTQAPPDTSGKESQKYEKVWLKMSDKHQFKYYLDADDREEIKSQKS